MALEKKWSHVMRSRALTGITVFATTAVLALCYSTSASAHPAGARLLVRNAPAPARPGSVGNGHDSTSSLVPAKGKACYTNNETGDTGVAVTSADYSDNAADNTQGAVDFSVKKSCVIGTVQTTGLYYNGTGPANSVKVIIWTDVSGEPGALVNKQNNLPYTDETGTGALGVKLKKAVSLTKGNYFVSVVANMTLSSGGQWGWELTSNQIGNMDQWENQGAGFEVCPTWGDVLDCVGYGNDFMVTLSK
jgi:hypothetical protein